MKVTLVFYESAALVDIEAWVKSMIEKIKEYKKINGSERYIVLSKEGEDEILYCYNINNFQRRQIDQLLKDKKYYKTLVFGRMDSKNLMHVAELIKDYENV